MSQCRITVFKAKQPIDEFQIDQPVVVGRRDARENDPPPVALNRTVKGTRLIVADYDQPEVSRRGTLVVPISEDTVEIKNCHSQYSLVVVRDQDLQAGQSRRFKHEALVDLGSDLAIRIRTGRDTAMDSGESDVTEYRSLAGMPVAPGEPSIIVTSKSIRQFAESDAADINQLLKLALQVVREASGSDAFFQASAEAATKMISLDRTVVLLRRDAQEGAQATLRNIIHDEWCSVAEYRRPGIEGPLASAGISSSLLQRVAESRTTVIHEPRDLPDSSWDVPAMSPSLRDVQCAVASPILSATRRVIGILYGDRPFNPGGAKAAGISNLEATLVEILAGAVAGGIARRTEERLRTTLSGFFSPKVVERLANEPHLMDGRDTEATILFCDIRGFSSVTETLSLRQVFDWINDVMSELSECVIELDGVLVDYIGDALLAMWGAPGEQPDHARRAVEAARAMLTRIERLKSRWGDILHHSFGAGIGINTGPARVGNVGSRQRFKYGPLGNTVNLSSRLQSATKQFGVSCIASQGTLQEAGMLDQCRRLAKVSVVGIKQPVDVYQIVADGDAVWHKLREGYERTLSEFEQGHFEGTASQIGALLPEYSDDRPSRRLLARAVAEMDQPSQPFSAILQLTSK